LGSTASLGKQQQLLLLRLWLQHLNILNAANNSADGRPEGSCC
jgi:hypothetical protein